MNRFLVPRRIFYNGIRTKLDVYQPGSGLRSVSDIKEERKKMKETEDDPMAYTIFGNRRKKKDVFHYTDRRAGKGYSDYSNTIYHNRPYIWQPIRKYFWLNFYLAISILLVAFMFPFK